MSTQKTSAAAFQVKTRNWRCYSLRLRHSLESLLRILDWELGFLHDDGFGSDESAQETMDHISMHMDKARRLIEEFERDPDGRTFRRFRR